MGLEQAAGMRNFSRPAPPGLAPWADTECMREQPLTTPDRTEPDEATRGILEAVAESVGMTLVASRQLTLENTTRGFASGHELELCSNAGARETHIVYLETNPTKREREGVLTFRDEESGERIAVWLYPRDPELPALPAAVFPEAATTLLRRLGLDPSAVTLTVVAYRPGKRAVVRVEAPEFTVFLKVVRPAVAEDLHARYSLWRLEGVPVPRSLGWSADGFIAFAPLAGTEASQLIADLQPGAFLDAIDDLTARIGAIPSAGAARKSLAERLPWYLDRLLALLPEHTASITRIGEAIARVRERAGAATPVTIHGDLHVGQVFVDPQHPSRITGVLDIDTAGLGDPADDAAAFYAHLVVTAQHHRSRGDDDTAEKCLFLAERARDRWSGRADAGFALRARPIAATHLLGHILTSGAHGAELLAAAESLVAGALVAGAQDRSV
ncbi:Predicted kinase, aminoglycoside phosphotransferase (APT) family [Cryobacterium psychrotolerans]|uniref:Predicted kinase, aminoglycoside phosphotransferase (APT) family n=1 Tax=Cryobacterium psychrotolerans TaxID=386301 RepID=A0A1G9C379_9MICO|nr:Predicted kinase, aminoglycoside phosphotransferase (APT) family [Cryobacterium psychrotolerans]